MRNFFIIPLFLILIPTEHFACSMYKITRNGKTIVGNNEDWWNPNSQIWFEPKQNGKYGYMCVGFHDNFAQGAFNEGGLMFDGFFMPYKQTKDTTDKENVEIKEVIANIMQSYSSVEEVKNYLEKINLSDLTNSMLVFIDKSGRYLIVESDELFIGNEEQQSFSNFYPSLNPDSQLVDISYYQNGCKFIKTTQAQAQTSFDYCTSVMDNFKQTSTQYTTIYDLERGIIRLFHFQNFKDNIEINLSEELKKGKHKFIIPELFSKKSTGYKNYKTYNNANAYVKQQRNLWFKHIKGKDEAYIKEAEEGFNYVLNRSANDWLDTKNDIKRATTILKLLTELFPDKSMGYISLGNAYYKVRMHDLALENFKRAIQLDPTNEIANEMLIKIKEINASK